MPQALITKNFLRLVACISVCLCAPVFANEPITPIPDSLPHDPVKAALGKRLFTDVRLSKDDSISCESCHFLDRSGVDFLDRSIGIGGAKNKRNSPTVYNSALNFRQLWDGRAETLEQQIEAATKSPVVMGMENWDKIVDKVSELDDYSEAFKRAYGQSINADNIQHAIAEFEKTLLTPNSPFDLYLKGNSTAISPQAKKGYQYFKAYGCISCHQGVNVGGNLFQKMGVLKDIALHPVLGQDLGRYTITGNEWDKRVFRVPSLRLVSLTPPYFHDGSVATLSEAIDVMIEYQLGRQVPEEHKLAIIEFLKSLAGQPVQ